MEEILQWTGGSALQLQQLLLWGTAINTSLISSSASNSMKSSVIVFRHVKRSVINFLLYFGYLDEHWWCSSITWTNVGPLRFCKTVVMWIFTFDLLRVSVFGCENVPLKFWLSSGTKKPDYSLGNITFAPQKYLVYMPQIKTTPMSPSKFLVLMPPRRLRNVPTVTKMSRLVGWLVEMVSESGIESVPVHVSAW